MAHEDLQRLDSSAGSSNRAFGMVFAVLFGVIGAFPVLFSRGPRAWSLIVGALFLVAALLVPASLSPLNRLWTRFGLLLHRVMSPLALGIIFFLVMTPMGLLRRAMRSDPLRLRFDPGAPSYWIARQPPGPAPDSLRDQF